MRKTALLIAVFALGACHSQDKLSVEPATLEVIIDAVGSSKVTYSVKCSNPDATYVNLAVGEWEEWYSMTDQEIAGVYLRRLIDIDNFFSENNSVSRFQDRFCFKGDRTFRGQFLGRDMDYRALAFQVDPIKLEVVGEAVSTPFHTHPLPQVTLDFEISVVGDVLTLTPSDDTVPYYWDYESIGYFFGDDLTSSAYYYLYQVTDMYEEYGFIDHELSKGPLTYEFSVNDGGMVEGETIVIAAAPYVDHELTLDIHVWTLEYHKDPGKSILRAPDLPEVKGPVPVQPAQWQVHPSRKNR